jgi:formate dehydrogenase maturation protein FdhE
VLWAAAGLRVEDTSMNGKLEGTCPVCHQGDLISISMSVSGSDLTFTTCHLCEARWWYRDGTPVPLQSVIGSVLSRKA